MEDKIKVLNDLIKLSYYNGLHSGRWEDEIGMELSADEYLKTMIKFAEEYDVKFDDNLENYYVDDKYEPECYTKDNMGYEIYMKIENKLVSIILEA